MLPVVSGSVATKRQILIYSALLVPTSMLPWAMGFAGTVYCATAAICGAILLAACISAQQEREADRRAAHRLFVFSITYLFVLFAALLFDHRGGPRSSDVRLKVCSRRRGIVHVDLRRPSPARCCIVQR